MRPTSLRVVRRAFIVAAFSLLSPVVAQITEIPQTVAPGKVLLEMDGLRLSFDRADSAGNTYDALAVASTLVSVGLTPDLDIQIGIDFFLRQRVDTRGLRDRRSGIGDTSFRTKWTFWRDPQLGSAAVIPFVRLPSSTAGVGSDSIEGGVIVPWARDLGDGLVAGAMAEWDIVRNDANNGYDARWFLSAYGQWNLTSTLSVYSEATLEASSTGLSNWAGQLGVGSLWQVTKRLRLDYQILRGLNRRASEWTHVFRVNWEW